MKKNVTCCMRLTLWETVFFLFVLLFFCNDTIFIGKLSCLFSFTLDCCCVNFHKQVFTWIFDKVFVFFFFPYLLLCSCKVFTIFLAVVTDLELDRSKTIQGTSSYYCCLKISGSQCLTTTKTELVYSRLQMLDVYLLTIPQFNSELPI